MSAAVQASRVVPRMVVGQIRTTGNKLENLLNVSKIAGLAKENKACFLFLPEVFGFIGETSLQTLDRAEPPLLQPTSPSNTSKNNAVKNPVAISDWIRETVQTKAIPGNIDVAQEESKFADTISLYDGVRTIAQESGLWISATMHTQVELSASPPQSKKERRVRNTHFVIDNHGDLQGIYHKIHLFDVSIPGKVYLCESKTTEPGKEVVVVDSPVGKLGLTVCYDLRFPELFLCLIKKGAQVILVPSAFTIPTGKAHWHTLLRARAIESQCFIVAAAQHGKHNAKRESYGHSLVVDPWGKVVADAGGVDGSGTATDREGDCTTAISKFPVPTSIMAEIDVEDVASIRQNMPVQNHRNNAKYE